MINPPFQYTTTDPVFAVNGGSPLITALPPFQYTSIKPVFVTNPGNTNVYTKEESDARYPLKTNVYTKLQADDNIYIACQRDPVYFHGVAIKKDSAVQQRWAGGTVVKYSPDSFGAAAAWASPISTNVSAMQGYYFLDASPEPSTTGYGVCESAYHDWKLFFTHMVVETSADSSSIPASLFNAIGIPNDLFPNFQGSFLKVVDMSKSIFTLIYQDSRRRSLIPSLSVEDRSASFTLTSNSNIVGMNIPGIFCRFISAGNWEFVVLKWPNTYKTALYSPDYFGSKASVAVYGANTEAVLEVDLVSNVLHDSTYTYTGNNIKNYPQPCSFTIPVSSKVAMFGLRAKNYPIMTTQCFLSVNAYKFRDLKLFSV